VSGSGRALACAGLAALALGCQGGRIAPDELPDSPIAFSYRTPEEARRRAEAFEDRAKQQLESRRARPDPEQQPGASDGELFARADQVRDFFARVIGRGDEPEESYAGRLALLDPRTREVKLLEAARRGSIPLQWSADRTRLLLAQPGDRDFQLYEYERERGTVRPLTHGPYSHTQGCYAGADGRLVVATVDARSQPPRSRIEVSRPGGRGPFEPITEWGIEHSPSCAPDGSAVVWMRETEAGRSDLLIRSPVVDGETKMLAPGRQPRHSPDGAWIVFSAPVQRDWKIWRVRPDGTWRSPLGRGTRSEARPAVSPDGRYIVYVAAEKPPRRNLYLRRFDGTGDRILFADGDGEHPVW
jgi:dipeptidyl aminopeptidase/acylaminoacyl peptidase